METLTEIELEFREMLIRIEEARNLLYNGREIPCDRKLQGSQVKGNAIIKALSKLRLGNTDGVVANPSNEESQEVSSA